MHKYQYYQHYVSASVSPLAKVRLDLDPGVGRVLPDPLKGPVSLLPLVVSQATPVDLSFSGVVRIHDRN